MDRHRLALAFLLTICTVTAMSGVSLAQEDATSQRYFTGNALYNRKMYELAIEEYKLFLAEQPTHAKADNARMGMAMSYYSLGKYAEAEPLLNALVTKGTAPNVGQLRLLHAQSLLKLKKYGPAERQFIAVMGAASSAPVKATAVTGLLESQYGLKKWKAVVSSAKLLLKEKPSASAKQRAQYQLAYAAYQLKDYQAAIPHLVELQPMVTGGPLAHQVSYFLAECYRLTGELPKAAAQYRLCVKGFEGDAAAEINYRLGRVEFKQKKYKEAGSAFEEYLKQAPDGVLSGDAYLYLGRSYIELKQTDKAATYLDALCDGTKKIAEGGDVAEAVLWRARIYSRAGQHDKAAAFIGKHVAPLGTNPLVPDLLFDQANSLIAVRKYAAAADALKGVLQRANWPQANDALRLYAICLHHKGDFAGSLANANKFIAAHGKDGLLPEVLFVKAENLYFLKKTAEASAAYSLYLKSSPTGASANAAMFRLVQLLHRAEKWEDARTAAAPLLASRPKGKLFSQLDFIAGDCCFRLKDWKNAAVHLAKFAAQFPVKTAGGKKQEEPNADAALMELAVVHVKQKQAPQAVAQLTALATHCKTSPHLPMAQSELGRLHYEAKDYAAARAAFEAFVKAAPDNALRPSVEGYLGWISLAESKDAEAEQHFAVIASKYPKHPMASEAMLQRGLLKLAEKKYAEAEQSFKKLLAANPTHPQKDLVEFSLGVTLARRKNWQGAMPHFRIVVEKHPQSEYAPRALYELAWCSKGAKQNKAAIASYEKLLKAYPADKLVDRVRTELAELAFGAKDYDSVIKQLKDTLSTLTDPKLREQAAYRLGTAYFNKGAFAESADTFDAFVAKYPASALLASAHFQAGESYMKRKEMIKARDHFLGASKAKEIAADLKESVLIRLGETQGLAGDWKESASTYAAFLAAYPKSKWLRHARFGEAWALEKLKKYDEAITWYKQVIGSQKDELSARCQFQIGECLFASQKYDAAIKALIPVQVSYRYEDWSAKALLETGRIMAAKGDKAAAMDQFKEVIKRFPKHNAAVVAKQQLDAIRVGGM